MCVAVSFVSGRDGEGPHPPHTATTLQAGQDGRHPTSEHRTSFFSNAWPARMVVGGGCLKMWSMCRKLTHPCLCIDLDLAHYYHLRLEQPSHTLETEGV